VREYELGCGHSGNELSKKNPETQPMEEKLNIHTKVIAIGYSQDFYFE
jgi:hypothetical protein